MVMLAELNTAAHKLVFQLVDELEIERARELAAIDDAFHTHMSIGDNYWHRRYMVEQRLRAARALLMLTEE